MSEARVRYALIALIAAVLAGSGVALYAHRRPAPPPIVISLPPSQSAPTVSSPGPVPNPPSKPPTPTPTPKYYVHVAGAVKQPSLYLLPAGSRVMQAVKAAGGPTAKADLDAINLAEKVQDGEKVYIPQKSATVETAMLAPPGNTIGHGSVTPDAPPATSPATAPAEVTKAAKGGAGKAAKLSSPSQGMVNINTAGADQLQRLPGIGPAMAARILAYRQQAGGFQKVDELQEISGIGPKKYAKIAPLVKIQ